MVMPRAKRRFEIAPGYHESASRVEGQSYLARALARLAGELSSHLEFTGAWFTGRDLAGLGTLRQGFTILESGQPPSRSTLDGGWGQSTFTATSRWSFHIFGGEEDDRARDLIGNGITRNFVYGGNAMWRLAPNVIASFEMSQARTAYLISGHRLNDHYDLALAYLF